MVEPCIWIYTNFFADYYCPKCLDCMSKHARLAPLSNVEHFKLSLKIKNGRRQLMKNRHRDWVCGRNVGVCRAR